MTDNLERAFEKAMFEIYHRAKTEANYTAKFFLNMISDKGGLGAAKFLINAEKHSDGYTALYLKGKLNLTMEAMIVENRKWHKLFSLEEIEKANRRLKSCKYEAKIE